MVWKEYGCAYTESHHTNHYQHHVGVMTRDCRTTSYTGPLYHWTGHHPS